MKKTAKCFVLLLGLFVLVTQSETVNAAAVVGYSPTTVQGHSVWISDEFSSKDPGLLKRVLATLKKDFQQIDNLMPAAAKAAISSTAIWLELETGPLGEVSGNGAVYHPSSAWLKKHGQEPAMVRGIQVCSARNYLKWRNGKVGMTVLHELAHAYYHDIKKERSQVKVAYKRAAKKGIYNKVGYMQSEKKSGQLFKAYAMTNPHEYFAELSEAYFGCNDYFPYNRQQLKEHDPEGYEIVHKIWNK
jgi:hypothetical protein